MILLSMALKWSTNLKVGKTQDHYGVTSAFYATQPVTLHRSASWLSTQIAGIKYLLFGTGDAAYPPCSGGAFIKSSPEKDLPDTQLHYVSVQSQDQHFREGVTLDHGFGCIAYICRPQSRGYLTLKSADANDEPLLYPNYLSEEEDVIDTRNAFRETRRILMQPALILIEENHPSLAQSLTLMMTMNLTIGLGKLERLYIIR